MDAADEPHFGPGERTLVFLSKDTGNLFALEKNEFTIEGAFQGKFSVVRIKGEEMAVGVTQKTGVKLDALIDVIRKAGA
jgi:hypothetical protein